MSLPKTWDISEGQRPNPIHSIGLEYMPNYIDPSNHRKYGSLMGGCVGISVDEGQSTRGSWHRYSGLQPNPPNQPLLLALTSRWRLVRRDPLRFTGGLRGILGEAPARPRSKAQDRLRNAFHKVDHQKWVSETTLGVLFGNKSSRLTTNSTTPYPISFVGWESCFFQRRRAPPCGRCPCLMWRCSSFPRRRWRQRPALALAPAAAEVHARACHGTGHGTGRGRRLAETERPQDGNGDGLVFNGTR